MLPCTIYKEHLPEISYPKLVQPQLDGIRTIWRNGHFIKKTGEKFQNSNLKFFLSAIDDKFVLDGFLYMAGHTSNDIKNLLSSEETLPSLLKFYIWDVMPKSSWDDKNTYQGYSDRLRNVHLYGIVDNPNIELIGSRLAADSTEVKDFYENFLQSDFKGAIIRAPESQYKWGKTTFLEDVLFKLNPLHRIYVPIIDVVEGKGRRKGMLGKFLVQLPNQRICGIGSGAGFSSKNLQEWWINRKQMVGRVIEVVYRDLSPEGLLLNPQFRGFRTKMN